MASCGEGGGHQSSYLFRRLVDNILQIVLPPFPILGRDFPPDAAGLRVSASRSGGNTDTYWLRFSYLEVLPENLAERLAEFFRVS